MFKPKGLLSELHSCRLEVKTCAKQLHGAWAILMAQTTMNFQESSLGHFSAMNGTLQQIASKVRELEPRSSDEMVGILTEAVRAATLEAFVPMYISSQEASMSEAPIQLKRPCAFTNSTKSGI